MITGTVNLSLADVDKLRQELKDSQDALKAKETELAEVKADKRTVYVERVRPLSKNDLRITMASYNARGLLKELQERENMSMNSSFGFHDYHRNRDITLNNHVDVEVKQGKTEEKISYVNFDDIQQELRTRIEKSYQEEVAKLKADTKYHAEKLADAEAKWERQNIDLQIAHEKEKSALLNQIADWDKKYQELEKGKKELTLIEELSEKVVNLQKELDDEKTKKWYQKF